MGITPPVAVVMAIIGLALLLLLLNSGNAIGDAPLFNKVLGIGLGAFAVVFMFKSNDWLDFIKSDKRKLLFQIVITIAIAVLSLLVLAVFHSGPLGTTTNPM